MVKIILHITLLIITLFVVAGCCKVGCDKGAITLSFENYKRHEVDSVYFIGIVGGQVKDSFAITIPLASTDTMPATHSQSLDINYDTWRVVIHSVQKQFVFSNYEMGKQNCPCGSKKIDVLKAYTVNGLRVTDFIYRLPR